MCKKCVKEEFPDRLTMCLDNGEFYPNFVGCTECSRTDVLHVENRVTQQDDDEETVIYEHKCKACGHLVASHMFRFRVEGDFQEYEMSCLLCGSSEDSRSVLPYDPRQQPLLA